MQSKEMKNMKSKQNNYAFIDSQNLNLSIRDCGWKLNFAKFRIYLKDKYKVKKAFLFIGYVAGNEGLYTSLQKAGYIVIFKPTLEYKKEGERFTKGNVDAELVLHAMIEYPNYDKAVIVSGDGDFHCLIEYLEKQDKLLRLLIPDSNKYSALLRRFRKYFNYLDRLDKKLGVDKKKERE
ncbi:MAG: NYN domain-containing protein [Candidatus Omnitrophica bacterium]|nr:NYN domain-containing protein [Candidatus Omnitrophota bacterium]MCK4423388.1 NYN domain-containing protein [Candidatus Omnitrophota bacterium]